MLVFVFRHGSICGRLICQFYFFFFAMACGDSSAFFGTRQLVWVFDVPFGHVNRHAVVGLEIAIGRFSLDRQLGGVFPGHWFDCVQSVVRFV